ncbi:hypothetical protein EVAR_86980_1 [Eumeta japonica]|uniref:Uncharacterized protein n=1 Tax=Eumeta variegata TaxID=151549 RepID=A0A4C1W9C8_EUMVA|nr:hypothetical protein EVAR_86980_1 [Eumeta japonica]
MHSALVAGSWLPRTGDAQCGARRQSNSSMKQRISKWFLGARRNQSDYRATSRAGRRADRRAGRRAARSPREPAPPADVARALLYCH